MRKVSLRRFLTTGLLTVFLCGILTVGALLHSTNYSANAIEKLAESVESAAAAQKIEQNFAIHRRQSLAHEPAELQTARLLEASKNLSKSSSSDKEETIIKKVQGSILSYVNNYNSLVADGYSIQDIRGSGTQEYYRTLDAILELTQFNLDEAKNLKAEATNNNRLNYFFISISLALLCISLLVLLIGLSKYLYRPVFKLKNMIESFELGESVKIGKFEGALEIQSIASSFANLSSKLSRQKDMQHTFLSAIAHDLKNPLSAIKMSTELMTEDHDLTSHSREILEIVGRQTDHLTRLINDLLDTTRIESGHMEFRYTPSDIRKLIQDSAVLHASLSKIHQIDVDLPNQPLMVMCDAQRLTQVFNNLLNNAIKYSPNGGKISIQAKASNRNHVTIIIQDSGVGILEDDISEIFEPYRRSSATRDSIPGIGLGLSVSRKILRAHKGDISVQSAIGKGTTFTITLQLIADSVFVSQNELQN